MIPMDKEKWIKIRTRMMIKGITFTEIARRAKTSKQNTIQAVQCGYPASGKRAVALKIFNEMMNGK